MERRMHRALLPPRVVTHLIADHVVPADRRLNAREVLLAHLRIPLGGAAEHVVHAMPRDADAGLDVLAVIGMNALALLDGGFEPLRMRHALEAIRGRSAKDVRAEHHAFRPMNAVARIPDLRDVLRGPGNAAVDHVALPEALAHLEADLEELAAWDGREHFRIVLREVVRDSGHELERNTVETVVRGELVPAVRVSINDVDGLVSQHHRLDACARLHE